MGQMHMLSRTRRERVPLGSCVCPPLLVDLLTVPGLAKRFDWDGFGYPLVWETSPGVFRVLDGVQRIAAACTLYPAEYVIEVEVIRGITPEYANELRKARNDHEPVDPDEPRGMRLI